MHINVRWGIFVWLYAHTKLIAFTNPTLFGVFLKRHHLSPLMQLPYAGRIYDVWNLIVYDLG